jgi:hypothetical protein
LEVVLADGRVDRVAARRPDGCGALQLHVHPPTARRRAAGVPASRADKLADDAGRGTRRPPT